MAGSWSALTNSPPATVCTVFLLTDGSVLAQGVSTNKWYRLKPDVNGNYANGTWTTAADSPNAPLYYASGILRDGRLIVAGGEYDSGAFVMLKTVQLYDPVANTWTPVTPPAGWVRIGDAPGCVLPDGRFIVGQVLTAQTAIFDTATNGFTPAANKLATVGEESWSLLPDGTIHAVDCSDPPNAEKYIIAADEWVEAGVTPQVLVDSISEIGASALLPDGRLLVIGATGYTALYTMPPVANQPGSWVAGPSIPPVNPGEALGTVDAPAAVLPNGRVLFSTGPITVPATFQSPSYFFEYDPITNSHTAVPGPTNEDSVPYFGRMLMLPSGQVLYTAGRTLVELYTPDGAPDPVWRPTITNCPATLRRGKAYTLKGRQLNGLTQCIYYGNDATQATNYPIMRLESTTSDAIVYCRTYNFSTMGLQTGTVVHSCRFRVPATTPLGCYRLVVIANGIASAAHNVCVTNKWWKELKWEIKEKNEIIEYIDINLKRVPDFIDPKLIREGFEDFRKFQEEWLQTARTFAMQIDQAQEEMARTFIQPAERPEVEMLPEIEKIEPRKVSAAEAKKGAEKRAYNDGRKEIPFTKEAIEIREKVHSLSRSKPQRRGKGRKR